MSSGFDLNFFGLPGSIRRILERDRAKAEVKGKFYVRRDDGSLRRLGFKIGAGAGTGAVLLTSGDEVEFPAEQKLMFKLGVDVALPVIS